MLVINLIALVKQTDKPISIAKHLVPKNCHFREWNVARNANTLSQKYYSWHIINVIFRSGKICALKTGFALALK